MLARHRAAATPGIVPGKVVDTLTTDPDRYPGDPFTVPSGTAASAAVPRKPAARRKPAGAAS